MCEKALFVFTSPGWPEYEKHWVRLDKEQLSFSESKGKVFPFDGKEYSGGSGWEIEKIIKATKDLTPVTEKGLELQELVILIHETADDILANIRQELSKMFSGLTKPPLVYGYTSAADNEFFRRHITPMSLEVSLHVNHFDRLWDFIWTDDSCWKAIERRSRTLLPFISLHLLMTAKCGSLPEDMHERIRNEINQSRLYYDLFFDSLSIPLGKCLANFKALKKTTEAGLQEGDLQQMKIEDLGGYIQNLLACLSTQLTAFMNQNSEAV